MHRSRDLEPNEAIGNALVVLLCAAGRCSCPNILNTQCTSRQHALIYTQYYPQSCRKLAESSQSKAGRKGARVRRGCTDLIGRDTQIPEVSKAFLWCQALPTV